MVKLLKECGFMFKFLLSLFCCLSIVGVYTTTTDIKLRDSGSYFSEKTMEEYKLYDILIDDILDENNISHNIEKVGNDYVIKIDIEKSDLIPFNTKDYEERRFVDLEDSHIQTYNGVDFIVKKYKKEDLYFSLSKKLNSTIHENEYKPEYYLDRLKIENIKDTTEFETILDSTVGLKAYGKSLETKDYKDNYTLDRIKIRNNILSYDSSAFHPINLKETDAELMDNLRSVYSFKNVGMLILGAIFPFLFIIGGVNNRRTQKISNFSLFFDKIKNLKPKNRKKARMIHNKVKKQKIKNEIKNKEKQEEVKAEIENI